jgi:hypothetical protein
LELNFRLAGSVRREHGEAGGGRQNADGGRTRAR